MARIVTRTITSVPFGGRVFLTFPRQFTVAGCVGRLTKSPAGSLITLIMDDMVVLEKTVMITAM